MSECLLRLEAVQTHIGAYHILHGVNLTVASGQVTVLLGRNGAGKSTTLRTIMGLWQASSGSIAFEGTMLNQAGKQLPTPDIASLGIAYVPENMGIFSDLTVRENMLLAAKRAKTVEQIDQTRLQWLFGLFPALNTFWQKPAGLLSGGQKQMLAIARAVVEPRKLLLIDEPSKGLAPSIVKNLGTALTALKAEHTSILLVEQNFHFASGLGDQVAVMDAGRIVHQGAMAELRADLALQQRLLGLSL